MKKSLFTLIIAMMAIGAMAQEGRFYISAYGGLGMNLSPAILYTDDVQITYFNNVDSTTYYDTYSSSDYSFGKGTRYGITVGARLTEEIPGLNLQLSVFKQAKSTVEYNRSYKELLRDWTDIYANYKYSGKLTGSALYINPALTMQIKLGGMRPYMKLGALIMFPTVDEEVDALFSTNMPYYNPNSTAYKKCEYETETSFGVDFGIGTTCPLDEGFSLFGELCFQYVRTSPIKRTVVEYQIDGSDKLGSLSTSERVIEYVDGYSTYHIESSGSPTKELRTNFSFNAVAINAGIVYQF